MGLSRYSFVPTINFNGRVIYRTNQLSFKIFEAVESNTIQYSTHVLKEGERLDTVAGKSYNDSKYWWIIAAASGIGWSLQVPPGTFLKIPNNLNEVFREIV